MIILADFTAKILRRVKIKIANQCLFFYQRQGLGLRAHKSKRITTVKMVMTTDNVLACTKPKDRYIQQHKKNPGLLQQI